MQIGDKVKVIPFEGIEGTIEGIYYSYKKEKYFIRYFISNRIDEEYFYADELEVIKDKNNERIN